MSRKLRRHDFYARLSLRIRQDEPRFAHRGLLIDSSRNFLTVGTVKRTIDALAATKMNVLHWHIVDSQSFPFEVPEYPRLTDAAYSEAEIYSPADLEDIVSYAYYRGVRIMPEFGTLPDRKALLETWSDSMIW